VRTQQIRIGGALLDEVAYGWLDIREWPRVRSVGR
jgi:hypothetical protein